MKPNINYQSVTNDLRELIDLEEGHINAQGVEELIGEVSNPDNPVFQYLVDQINVLNRLHLSGKESIPSDYAEQLGVFLDSYQKICISAGRLIEREAKSPINLLLDCIYREED